MPSLSAFWRKEPTVLLVNFMGSKLSDMGFRILTTSDFLFGLLSQLQLLILEGFCSTGDLLLNHPMPGLIFAFPRLNRTFLQKIQRCSISLEMSNKVALVSLDFAGTGSMCDGNKGVAAMDAHLVETTIKTYLAEIRSRLDKAAGIGRAADACAGAGFHEKGLEVALDMEQLLYEATALLNAASLINRIGQQS
jgi:hypothetical protein